jgi:hypothetical protein
MEGDMTGQRPSGEDYEILGGGTLLEERTVFLYFLLDIFLVFEFGWIVIGVHQVAGSFGLGGQESSWNPGARELDRICS